MKTLLIFLALISASSLLADDRIRDVQSALKTQGFYYGEINGDYSTETTAALRRYQIRNGLEVTGTLTDETTKSLGLASAPVQPNAAPPATRNAAPQASSSTAESDRSFLRHEEARQRSAATPPAPARTPTDDSDNAPPPRMTDRRYAPSSTDYLALFAGTPFANAPREVQQSTVRRAQSMLGSRGFYREPVDGNLGPATEEAILTYQRSVRLPLSGRLDLETLSAMRLLPGRSAYPPTYGEPRRIDGAPIYRGIWVR